MPEELINLARQAVQMKSKFGNSDVGDVLVRLLQEKISLEEAMEDIGYLIEDYKRTPQ